MGNKNSILALDALRDIYALALYNIKLSCGRQESQFMTYYVLGSLIRDYILEIIKQMYEIQNITTGIGE